MKYFRWILQFIKFLSSVKDKPYKESKITLGKSDFTSKQVDDMPNEDEFKSETVYIVGENGYSWLAAFQCPCGCKDIIQLNLLPEANPNWKIYNKKGGKITISPSVERIVGCKSHFNLTNGKAHFLIYSFYHS